MGITSTPVDAGAGTPANGNSTPQASVPTYLSGESLTFPLITSVGAAALTMYTAVAERQPTAETVIVVAVLCGLIVTLWGVADSRRAGGTVAKLDRWEIFRRSVIGLANTLLLSVALWGGVKVAQVAVGG